MDVLACMNSTMKVDNATGQPAELDGDIRRRRSRN